MSRSSTSVRNILLIVLLAGFAATTAFAEKKKNPKPTESDSCDAQFSVCANYCDKSKKTNDEIEACEDDCLDEANSCKNRLTREQPFLRKDTGGGVLER